MRRALVALIVSLALTVGVASAVPYPPVQIVDPGSNSPMRICPGFTTLNVVAAGTTVLLAHSGTTSIYVCGFFGVMGGTSPSLGFSYGTGTNCGTGTTVIVPPMVITAGQFFDYPAADGSIFIVPSGDDLCIVAGGTTPTIAGLVETTQF